MKNIFKILSIAFAASAMLVACDPGVDTPDEPDTPTGYTVNVTCNDNTMGTVTKTPNQDTYEAGTAVTIAATPADGYKFLNWNGTITENPYSFTVSGNATYTANFEALPQAEWGATFNGTALDIAGYADFQTNGELWLLQFAKQAEGTSVYFPYLVMWMQGNSTSNFSVYPNGAIELYKDTYYTSGSDQYGDWQYYATNNINCSVLDLTTLMVSFTGSFEMYDLGDIVNGNADDPAGCAQATLAVTGTNLTFVMATKGMQKMNVVK